MEKLIGEYSVVEIPEMDDIKDSVNYFFIGLDNKVYANCGQIDIPLSDLPPGNYELIGISDEITEEQTGKIVAGSFVCVHEDGNHFDEYFKDYEDQQQIVKSEYSLQTAKESFQSLLISKGLKGRYAILKTIKIINRYGK